MVSVCFRIIVNGIYVGTGPVSHKAYMQTHLQVYLRPAITLDKSQLYTTMTSQWAWWRLKSPASWLFTQPFVQAQIKENIKAARHWPLWGEFTGHRWIPRTKGQ